MCSLCFPKPTFWQPFIMTSLPTFWRFIKYTAGYECPISDSQQIIVLQFEYEWRERWIPVQPFYKYIVSVILIITTPPGPGRLSWPPGGAIIGQFENGAFFLTPLMAIWHSESWFEAFLFQKCVSQKSTCWWRYNMPVRKKCDLFLCLVGMCVQNFKHSNFTLRSWFDAFCLKPGQSCKLWNPMLANYQ